MIWKESCQFVGVGTTSIVTNLFQFKLTTILTETITEPDIEIDSQGVAAINLLIVKRVILI